VKRSHASMLAILFHHGRVLLAALGTNS